MGVKIPILALITLEYLYLLFPYRKMLENQRLSKRRTPLISGQKSFPQWCPLIRESTVVQISFNLKVVSILLSVFSIFAFFSTIQAFVRIIKFLQGLSIHGWKIM